MFHIATNQEPAGLYALPGLGPPGRSRSSQFIADCSRRFCFILPVLQLPPQKLTKQTKTRSKGMPRPMGSLCYDCLWYICNGLFIYCMQL